jgi:dinuclear metal center YbgI/SA1388 family protein
MPNDPADSCDRARLVSAADALLQPARFKDYGPNGLQVEGKPQIRKLVSGVTASLALIDAAIEHGADAIFVHHGLFWRGQDGRVTGWMKQRLAKLLAHDINLLAYHLPLDAHPELGNNAQLAQRLGLSVQGHFGEQDLGLWGEPQNPDPGHFLAWAQRELGREPVLVQADPGRPWRRIGWCSGGAQSYFEAAIAAGVDAFFTGEISEPQAHLARETGVAFIAFGHHATERWGAQAVASHLARELGLAHTFIDIPNPA